MAAHSPARSSDRGDSPDFQASMAINPEPYDYKFDQQLESNFGSGKYYVHTSKRLPPVLAPGRGKHSNQLGI